MNLKSGEPFNEIDTISDKTGMFDGDLSKGKVLFCLQTVKALLDEQQRDSRLKPLLSAMLAEGNWRPYALITDKVIMELLTLYEKFPNFIDVIQRYEKSLILASLVDSAPIYLPPLLLVGPPGVGKTRFLCELSRVLGVGLNQVDMSSTTAGFVLAGGSTSWADGKPGTVSESLRKGKVANPIILVDEIDKATPSQYDPLGSLYTLLEKDTAVKFRDEALSVAMDCSAINWLASANYIEHIPAPILSRFSVVNIDVPTSKQMPVIVRSVYEDLLADNSWGALFNPKLEDNVVTKIAACSPREQKRVLFEACSEAAFKRKQNSKKVGLISIKVDDVVLKGAGDKRGTIGFL